MNGYALCRRWLASLGRKGGTDKTLYLTTQVNMRSMVIIYPVPDILTLTGVDYQSLSDVCWEDSGSF